MQGLIAEAFLAGGLIGAGAAIIANLIATPAQQQAALAKMKRPMQVAGAFMLFAVTAGLVT